MNRHTPHRLLLALLIATALSAVPLTQSPPQRQEQQVRDAELAFAQTMADRDHRAFSTFVAEDAIFLSPDRALRGRAAVAEGWKPYFEGQAAPFSWEPERVEVIAGGDLALSTGPVRDPQGKRVGTFTSTWRRDTDGRWRVILDSGCPPCQCPAAEAGGSRPNGQLVLPASRP